MLLPIRDWKEILRQFRRRRSAPLQADLSWRLRRKNCVETMRLKTMKTNIRLVTGLLLCVTFPAGCRRVESHPKPIKPVQTQEARKYFPGAADGDGERYSASILPSSQNELAFKYGGYLSEIH